jgi:hypothetical protein
VLTRPRTSAVTAAIVRVFAMVLGFMIISFAFIKLTGSFLAHCSEVPFAFEADVPIGTRGVAGEVQLNVRSLRSALPLPNRLTYPN